MEQDQILELKQKIMLDIWKKSPKEATPPPPLSGEYVRYWHTDLHYLYYTGFVDTKRFKIEEWEAAFSDCKQEDGTYYISQEKFLGLSKFKFLGVVKNPLDPMKIREGWYDMKVWHNYWMTSLLPSTTLTEELVTQGEKAALSQGLIVNGRIYIDQAAKLRIKQILEQYPSPTRLREISVHEIIEEKLKKQAEKLNKAQVETSYEQGEKLGAQEKRDLKEVFLKTKTLKNTNQQPQKETFSLKDLRGKSKTKKQSV